MDDPPPKVEIGASRTKLVLLTIAGIVMTAGSALLASRRLPSVLPGSYGEFIGWVGLIFFGLCTLLIVWRLFTSHGVVLTLDSEGIHDKRITDKVIPWNAVRGISTWQSQRQRIMIVAVDPDFERSLNLSRLARMAREASKRLGADGLSIGTNDLKTDHDTLFRTATAFWKANT